jgi:hypothetical protein
MSINWAVIRDGVPVALPHEVFDGRTFEARLELTDRGKNTNISTNATVFVSNQRLVLIPADGRDATYRIIGKGDSSFRSLSVSHVNVLGCKVVQPWFGPNRWEAMFTAVAGGGLDTSYPWNLCLTFMSGGVFDFAPAIECKLGAARQARHEGMDEALPAYSEL